jgi:hypothetical protein
MVRNRHLGITRKPGAILTGRTPGVAAEILGLLNEWIMPAPAARKTFPQKSAERESSITEGMLTHLTRSGKNQ